MSWTAQLAAWSRIALRRIDDWDLRSRLRHLSRQQSPRRIFGALCVFSLLVYIFYPTPSQSTIPVGVGSCVEDQLRHWRRLEEEDIVSIFTSYSSNHLPTFIGNGYFGVGVGLKGTGQLRFASLGTRSLALATGFYPLVQAVPQNADGSSAEAVVTDYTKGVAKHIQCFHVEGECGCIVSTTYVHRTRPHVFVQDLQIVNPTKETLRIDFNRKPSPQWTSTKSFGDTSIQTRILTDSMAAVDVAAAAICSTLPATLSVREKREESLRFTCVVNSSPVTKTESGDLLTKRVATEFAILKSTSSAVIDREHEEAWAKLNSVYFWLSPSKAPDALPRGLVNATRFALLTNARAPLLEKETNPDTRKALTAAAARGELCYTGHSTLLYPSKLWVQWRTEEELLTTADLWSLTLEKRGCMNVLKTGASGLAQAFVLSLAAASFHHGHFVVDADPADLHRPVAAYGIHFLDRDATIDVHFELDDENRPYMMAAATSSDLFACEAGCVNEAVQLGPVPKRLAVKVTKPLTSILYVAPNKKHLEELRSTIHVSEVIVAPAHEHEVIAMHKHGHRLGGLPTIFWVILGALVIAFHVFLIKLLYQEWRKGDTTPYNPYLRQRYIRAH